jgi:NAD-dependent SIR2 family protein deacetylase
VTSGPEIPNELLHAHEEGRVVFFCGAGISYPAGLKGFYWLVTELFQQLGVDITPLTAKALKIGRYDIALDLLERTYPGDRFAVRKELLDILQPDLKKRRALDTHKALLELSSSNEGILRLVTTNFDCLFAEAAKKNEINLKTYSAPLLPIPKNSKWNGLVYLHGSLPQKPEKQALNQIVLTSGDFGLAYISERWASRFVSELFRNYVVCFVGYGINDPVLRYIMSPLSSTKIKII